jgi:Thioredoxin.
MKRLQIIPTLILATLLSLVSCQTYETTISRRERNLDHWDAETLAAYLGLDPDTAKPLPDDQYVGIDAAVMFYAQWCSNCHRFATVWDTIGQLLHAGTTESNLIMALFNCELNQKHTRLCDAAGVTHYPTLMFVGAGPYHDSDPVTSAILGSKASGPYGPTTLPRTVKFQGNLNIGDSVLDWVKAMRGLSTWYKWNHMEGGWLRGIRSLLSNPFRRKSSRSKTENALPVGIPTGFYYSSSSSSSNRMRKGAAGGSASSTYALEKQLKTAQEKLDAVQNQLDENKLATTHAGYLIDSFLFPVTTNSTDTNNGNVSKVPVDIFLS